MYVHPKTLQCVQNCLCTKLCVLHGRELRRANAVLKSTLHCAVCAARSGKKGGVEQNPNPCCVGVLGQLHGGR